MNSINNALKSQVGIILLTGDKELEAVDNYMRLKHGKSIYDIVPVTDVRAFACNFLIKYNAEAVLVRMNNKVFYYPRFK